MSVALIGVWTFLDNCSVYIPLQKIFGKYYRYTFYFISLGISADMADN